LKYGRYNLLKRFHGASDYLLVALRPATGTQLAARLFGSGRPAAPRIELLIGERALPPPARATRSNPDNLSQSPRYASDEKRGHSRASGRIDTLKGTRRPMLVHSIVGAAIPVNASAGWPLLLPTGHRDDTRADQ
jgi:hypothetical protein